MPAKHGYRGNASHARADPDEGAKSDGSRVASTFVLSAAAAPAPAPLGFAQAQPQRGPAPPGHSAALGRQEGSTVPDFCSADDFCSAESCLPLSARPLGSPSPLDVGRPAPAAKPSLASDARDAKAASPEPAFGGGPTCAGDDPANRFVSPFAPPSAPGASAGWQTASSAGAQTTQSGGAEASSPGTAQGGPGKVKTREVRRSRSMSGAYAFFGGPHVAGPSAAPDWSGGAASDTTAAPSVGTGVDAGAFVAPPSSCGSSDHMDGEDADEAAPLARSRHNSEPLPEPAAAAPASHSAPTLPPSLGESLLRMSPFIHPPTPGRARAASDAAHSAGLVPPGGGDGTLDEIDITDIVQPRLAAAGLLADHSGAAPPPLPPGYSVDVAVDDLLHLLVFHCANAVSRRAHGALVAAALRSLLRLLSSGDDALGPAPAVPKTRIAGMLHAADLLFTLGDLLFRQHADLDADAGFGMRNEPPPGCTVSRPHVSEAAALLERALALHDAARALRHDTESKLRSALSGSADVRASAVISSAGASGSWFSASGNPSGLGASASSVGSCSAPSREPSGAEPAESSEIEADTTTPTAAASGNGAAGGGSAASSGRDESLQSTAEYRAQFCNCVPRSRIMLRHALTLAALCAANQPFAAAPPSLLESLVVVISCLYSPQRATATSDRPPVSISRSSRI